MTDAAATDAPGVFSLPDRFAGGPVGTFRFSPAAASAAAALLQRSAPELLAALLQDQESEAAQLAALCVLRDTLEHATSDRPARDHAGVRARLAEVREQVAARIRAVRACGDAAQRAALRERAAIALLDTCWLDAVSQPATQPSIIVNRLFAQYWRLKGEGNRFRSAGALRRQELQRSNVDPPGLTETRFVRELAPSAATALHAAFLVALGRFPVSHLPEIVGVHAALQGIGVDHLLFETDGTTDADEALGAFDDYLELLAGDEAGAALRDRALTACELAAGMELQHTELLVEIAQREQSQPLDAQVARIFARHAPYAGKHHGRVALGNAALVDLLGAPTPDLADLVRRLKQSPYLRPGREGRIPFVQALKFGGPMFGIFSAQEAQVLANWAHGAQAVGDVADAADLPGETNALARLARLREGLSEAVVLESCPLLDHRHLLHRMVNAERFPHVLEPARAHAQAQLARAQVLFRTGAAGRFTDASWFDYTPGALEERVESIYWSKLVDPYERLAAVPDRDTVIFGQKVFALGSLVDGSWVARMGRAGRYDDAEDAMLFAIYADEMGRGDLRKNHIALIYRVLESMGVRIPHLRDAAFLEQGEIPDEFYAFPLGQLALGLFADTFYPELIGYNLGIEMFGLGEMRLHEIQKLRRHRFDTSYEETHLSIDNLSAGHARQATDIIILHLDRVALRFGPAAAAQTWRRIWNGYAYFALHAEGPTLLEPPADDSVESDHVELVI
jgi:hypothetical protein